MAVFEFEDSENTLKIIQIVDLIVQMLCFCWCYFMFFSFFFLFKVVQIQMSMQDELPSRIVASVQSVKRRNNLIIFSIIIGVLLVIFVNTYVAINEEQDPMITSEKFGIVLLTIQVLVMACIVTYAVYLVIYYIIMGYRFI